MAIREYPISLTSSRVTAVLKDHMSPYRAAIQIPEYGRIKPATHYTPPCASHDGGVAICFDQSGLADWKILPCPYGQVGDRLWVRETWCPVGDPLGAFLEGTMPTVYKQEMDAGGATLPAQLKWKSPGSMPRWASRITLEVTRIEVAEGNRRWLWVIGYKRLEVNA